MRQGKVQANEIAQIIRGLAECLRTNPGQFHYEVHVSLTGVSAQASAPAAIGLQATAIGGGTGASIQTTVGDVDIQFAQAQADQAVRGQITEAVDALNQLAEELEHERPSEEKVRGLLDRIGDLAIPAIVSEMTRLFLRYIGFSV